jgi:tetratricopeptide (TPR) repeat protein
MTSGDVTLDLGLAGVLAHADMRVGNLRAALARYARAFESLTSTSLLDEDAAPLRVHYAIALTQDRDFDKALEVVEPVIAALDPSRPVSAAEATAIGLTANVYIQVARYTDAEHVLTRWQRVVDRSLGPRAAESATLVYEHAAAALGLGSSDVAEHASADALERDVEIFGASGQNTAIVRVVHGRALLELGQIAAARDDLERAVNDLTVTVGKANPFTIEGQVFLAEVYLREHKPADALALLEATLEPYRELQPDPRSMAGGELALAEALVATNGDLTRARALVDHALSLWAAHPAGSTGDVAHAKALRAKLRK